MADAGRNYGSADRCCGAAALAGNTARFRKGTFCPTSAAGCRNGGNYGNGNCCFCRGNHSAHRHPPDENGFCQACRTGFPRNPDGSGKHHAGSRNRDLSAGTECGFGGGTGTAAPHRGGAGGTHHSIPRKIGGFSNREQLLEVEGIGEATLYEIYDLLYLENETFPEPEPEPAGVPAPAAEPQPAETAPPATEPPAAAAPAVTFPLDLNQATAAELEQIPGMQPELAEKIVAFRQQIQAFSSVYELLYVDGMTEAYFVQLRDYVQITEERAQ